MALNVARRRMRVTDLDLDGVAYDIDPEGDTGEGVTMAGSLHVSVEDLADGPQPGSDGLDRFEVVVDGWRFRFEVEAADRARLRERARTSAAAQTTATPQTIRAQLPGRVVSAVVVPGEVVKLGQRLLAIEAMKMENDVRAPRDGTVESVSIQTGDRVESGDELVRLV